MKVRMTKNTSEAMSIVGSKTAGDDFDTLQRFRYREYYE
jgi:hypothetical protein